MREVLTAAKHVEMQPASLRKARPAPLPRQELTGRTDDALQGERDRLLEDLEREQADRLKWAQEEACWLREELEAYRGKKFLGAVQSLKSIVEARRCATGAPRV